MTAHLREKVIQEMLSSYANKPSEDQWEHLFDQATSTPEDPCDADVLSTYGWDAGFGSGVNILANELALAAYFGRTVARCTPPDQKHQSYYYLWQHPLRYCNRSELCTDVRQWSYRNESRTPWGYAAIFWAGCLNALECEMNATAKVPWLRPEQRHPGITPEFRRFATVFKHRAYDIIFRLNSSQQALSDDWAQAHGPPAGRPYVGVHLRGTDKFQEARSTPIREFVDKVQWMLILTNSSLVYLASDDWDLSLEFRDALKATAPAVDVLNKTRSEYLLSRRGGHPLARIERTIFMAELQILRHATGFVGTASSNIGRLVYFLRNPEADPALTLSVDDHGDFFSRFC